MQPPAGRVTSLVKACECQECSETVMNLASIAAINNGISIDAYHCHCFHTLQGCHVLEHQSPQGLF